MPSCRCRCVERRGEELSYLHINNQADAAIQLNKGDSETYLFFPLASVFVRFDLHRLPSDTVRDDAVMGGRVGQWGRGVQGVKKRMCTGVQRGWVAEGKRGRGVQGVPWS